MTRPIYQYLALAMLCLLWCESRAQKSSLRVSADFNVPLGELTWSYKSAPGVQLSYLSTKRIDKKWSRETGVTIGYTVFDPIADTLYYVVDDGSVDGMRLGRATFSPFKIYMLSLSYGFERRLNKKSSLSMSLAGGYYYGQRDYLLEDDFGASDGMSEFIGRGALVPRLGYVYELTKKFAISPFVSYSFMIQLGSTDASDIHYNPDVGLMMHYYSAGVAVELTF